MRVFYFSKCESVDDVDRTYKEMYDMFGLKRQPVDHFIRKAVDAEYKSVRETFEIVEQSPDEAPKNLEMDDVLAKIHGWNCEAEQCGSWLWLSGRNVQSRYKDLKDLGFRYAKNKKAYYWRPESAKSSNQEPMPMAFIREKYGTNKVALSS